MRVGWVLLLAPLAFAKETPAQVASKVLAALEDQAALEALAAQDRPDPWLVVGDLCERGEYDAALAFAKAAPRSDTAA